MKNNSPNHSEIKQTHNATLTGSEVVGEAVEEFYSKNGTKLVRLEASTPAFPYGSTREDPKTVYKHMAQLCRRQMHAFGMEAGACKLRRETAREFALVYRNN